MNPTEPGQEGLHHSLKHNTLQPEPHTESKKTRGLSVARCPGGPTEEGPYRSDFPIIRIMLNHDSENEKLFIPTLNV